MIVCPLADARDKNNKKGFWHDGSRYYSLLGIAGTVYHFCYG